uniref:Uncharacterized protein n=1 Tax=Rhizophora mucronata TaxID=61149 RepID=A0A2P2NUB5_RHIMU
MSKNFSILNIKFNAPVHHSCFEYYIFKIKSGGQY